MGTRREEKDDRTLLVLCLFLEGRAGRKWLWRDSHSGKLRMGDLAEVEAGVAGGRGECAEDIGDLRGMPMV